MEQNEVMNQEEAEDLLPEDLSEETQDDAQSLDEAIADEPAEQQEQQDTQSAGGQSEPGYVQKRISKAVEKALAQQREAFEAQMAPMREYMIAQEASELVRTGKVKDLETAKELVRYRQGQTQPVQQAGQEPGPARDNQGRFTSGGQQDSSRDPAVQARIDMLQHQANRIKTSSGIDVIAEFRNNEETRMKVVSGEMDFYDVAEQLRSGKKKPPAPMRSPNGASGMNPNAIDSMSDEQFDRMEKRIKEGARYALK